MVGKFMNSKTVLLVGLYILMQLINKLIESLTSIRDPLFMPIQQWVKWAPANDFEEIVHTLIGLAIYFCIFWTVLTLLQKLKKPAARQQPSDSPELELQLYEDEIAAVIESIDNDETDSVLQEQMEQLLVKIGTHIIGAIGLDPLHYRASFVVAGEKEYQHAAIRFGRQYELYRNDPEKFTELSDRDLEIVKAMDKISQSTRTILPLQESKGVNTDAKMILFIRNSGKFKLGFFISLLDEVELDSVWTKVEQASSVLLYLGHVDKIAELAVKFKQEGS